MNKYILCLVSLLFLLSCLTGCTGDAREQTLPVDSASVISPDEDAAIYAAVIRQVVTVDDTFGGTLKPPVIYIIGNTNDNVGNPTGGSSASVVISGAMQNKINGSLTGLPVKIVWIDKFEDAEFEDSELQLKSVKNGGVIITLGNIHLQDDGTVQLAGSIYIAPLAAGGMTYVLEKKDGTWTITGNTGIMWIS